MASGSAASVNGGDRTQAAREVGLDALLAGARWFFEQLQIFSAAEDGVAAVDRSTTKSVTTLQHLLRAASGLPGVEQAFSPAWPASVRSMLPSTAAGKSTAVWAPVLAWATLHASELLVSAELFDHLQLRSALAEAFSALDLHGDDAWRAAARVRLLLSTETETPATLLGSTAFWKQGDVRWLAGINQANDAEYMNKEQFGEVLSWLQLPALFTLAEGEASASLQAVEQVVAHATTVAWQAGYDVDRFVALWKGAPHSPTGRPVTPGGIGGASASAKAGPAAQTAAAGMGGSRAVVATAAAVVSSESAPAVKATTKAEGRESGADVIGAGKPAQARGGRKS